jgi:hypothetical protein
MKKAFAAFIFLTFGRRCKALDLNAQHFGPAIAYLPLGGVVLGSFLVLLNRLLDPYLESEIIGVTLVATQALMTGGIHFVGLQRTFDAFPATQNWRVGYFNHRATKGWLARSNRRNTQPGSAVGAGVRPLGARHLSLRFGVDC